MLTRNYVCEVNVNGTNKKTVFRTLNNRIFLAERDPNNMLNLT